MSNKAEELHLRLFFALPLPAPLAEQLEQWRRHMTLKGQLVLPDNFHLTLAFLGAQPSSLLPRLDHAGIPHDSQPYQPHVTLARHSHLPEQPAPCSITWQAREFALFVSEQRNGAPHYCAVQRWPLVAA